MAMTSLDSGLRGSWRRAALVALAVVVLAGTVVALPFLVLAAVAWPVVRVVRRRSAAVT